MAFYDSAASMAARASAIANKAATDAAASQPVAAPPAPQNTNPNWNWDYSKGLTGSGVSQTVDADPKITSYIPETAKDANEKGTGATLVGPDQAPKEAAAESADAIVGTNNPNASGTQENQIITAYSPDAQIVDKAYWDAHNAYTGAKGNSLYDWATNPEYYDEWYAYVNDPTMSQFYQDDFEKFGDLSDKANFDAYWNQYNGADLGAAFNSSDAAQVDLLNQWLGTDANVRTAINTGLYDSGIGMPASGVDADGNFTYGGTGDRDTDIAAMDYTLMMQALASGADPAAIQDIYDINDMNYMNRYTGTVYDTLDPGNGAAALQAAPDAMTGAYGGGIAYINPQTLGTTDSLVSSVYGDSLYALPTESTKILAEAGQAGATDRWNEYFANNVYDATTGTWKPMYYNSMADPASDQFAALAPDGSQAQLMGLVTPEAAARPVLSGADGNMDGYVTEQEALRYAAYLNPASQLYNSEYSGSPSGVGYVPGAFQRNTTKPESTITGTETVYSSPTNSATYDNTYRPAPTAGS